MDKVTAIYLADLKKYGREFPSEAAFIRKQLTILDEIKERENDEHSPEA